MSEPRTAHTVATGYVVVRRKNVRPRRHVFATVTDMLTSGTALCGARLSNWDRREMTVREYLGEPPSGTCPACRREVVREVEVVKPADLAPGDRIRLGGQVITIGRVKPWESPFGGNPARWAVFRAEDDKLFASFYPGDRVERVHG